MAISKSKLIAERDKIRNIEKVFQIKILHPGDAVNFPKDGDSISVGFLEDGTCFDDSYNRGHPIYFILGTGQVLKGWEIIIPILSRGQKARFTLPPEYAYDEKGYPPIIAPNATLIFEVELLSFTSFGQVERETREKKLKQEIKQTKQLIL